MFIAANWKAYVETAEQAKKLFTVSKRLIPISCVGEPERNESTQYLTSVREEILSALTPLSNKGIVSV